MRTSASQRIDLDELGFTLVELSLVIVVIGLLLGFGITAWMSMKTSQQISATTTTLKTAASCLSKYVIHSEQTPAQTYFSKRCVDVDPWGQDIIYYNNGDNQEISSATTKTVRDGDGDHPDALWMIVSSGPNGTIETTSSATLWDCSLGDDLCQYTTKNALVYEINK